MQRDERVVRRERGELVRRGHEWPAGQLGELGCDALGEFGVRVQAGADRGAAERELVDRRSDERITAIAASSCATQPEISWPSVSGVASCRCVRPILTMSANARALRASVARSARDRRQQVLLDALDRRATCIAVGNVSFSIATG